MASEKGQASASETGNLKWWQLSLLGVGCIIGTGFFLGSGLGIKEAGPSILLAFIVAAFATYVVFDALARLTAEHPEKGSFCAYAKHAFGRWAGFSNGWVYWSSEILIMGSQLTALGLFTRFWFPHLPLWLLATIYAVLGLLVVFIGRNGFEKVENVMAIIKILGIVMFIVIGAMALFGIFGDHGTKPDITKDYQSIFPHGMTGLWSSLIYAFYTFGGIEIMGLMAINLKEPKDGPKSGKVMLLLLTIIYVLSVGLAILLVSWTKFNAEESPFVIALNDYQLPFMPHIFNAILIIAGFSTMVASLFAVTNLLVTLSESGDAPKVFSKKGKFKVSLPSLCVTAGGLALSIIMSLLLPNKIYEHITTAAGLMLLYTWIFILFSFKKLLKLKMADKVKRLIGLLFIVLAVSGTLLEKTGRPGFFISLGFLIAIAAATLIMRRKWKTSEA
ncbi:amino acid permease [Peribacillus cavernae]|uniref:Amino acid permease n=1 Tax=Peribacillus cavernae TaxID=1674310 RepID=A0A3S1B3Y9_9BACI|nr:amino acid permease [Peribacillus cavernae]MDQ0220446.1 L-asparagine transporter-like permease [Peribacillus cavernae]RUQ28047.1 amino acid permease [Peribacillus cavernae]